MENKIILYIMIIFLLFQISNIFSLGKIGYIRNEGANIRFDPDKDAKIIIAIPINSKIEIIEVKNNYNNDMMASWFKIKYKNYTGWVQGVFLFLINDDNFEQKISNLENEKNSKVLISKFKSTYKGGYQPELIFNKNKTFNLIINRCAFLTNISGTYIYKDNKIICYNIIFNKFNDIVFDTIFKRLIIEFEFINDKELIITNDLFYDDGIEKYGFCSPNKGEIFSKQ